MSEQRPQDPQAVAASFGEHLRTFHDSLPPDEQALLEQVVALAEAAAQERDTAGYQGSEEHAGLTLRSLHLWLSSPRNWKWDAASLVNAWPSKITGPQ